MRLWRCRYKLENLSALVDQSPVVQDVSVGFEVLVILVLSTVVQHPVNYNTFQVIYQDNTRGYDNHFIRDRSIFIGGGGVQKAIGQILFSDKIVIELELVSTSAMIGY